LCAKYSQCNGRVGDEITLARDFMPMSSCQPERRRIIRVPCASAVVIDSDLGVVINASLGGAMIRLPPPIEWASGDRVTITIDTHSEPLLGEVIGVWEDKISIRFLDKLARLCVDAEGCVITIQEKATSAPHVEPQPTLVQGNRSMASPTDSDPPDPPALDHLRPVGERELERIKPDSPISVRLQAPGTDTPVYVAAVLDLSLHGMLVTRIPELAQGDSVDILDIEPAPIRGRVVRQSDSGTHVAFPSHIRPRYSRASANQPEVAPQGAPEPGPSRAGPKAD
jgi:hypothetical protein